MPRTVARRPKLADQVEALLADQLRSGSVQAGEQLPSEHELAAELGVSRATVRIALAALAKRGLVIGRQGVGNFASHAAQMQHDLTEAIDLNDLIGRSGRTPGVIFDRVQMVEASRRVAEDLHLDAAPSEQVLQCHKRFTADGVPVVFALNCLPAHLFADDVLADLVHRPERTEPLFPFLAELGLATSFQTSTLGACRGDQIPYPGHGLDPDQAVVHMTEVGYTANNEPSWHSRNWYAPDAMAFQLVRRPRQTTGEAP